MLSRFLPIQQVILTSRHPVVMRWRTIMPMVVVVGVVLSLLMKICAIFKHHYHRHPQLWPILAFHQPIRSILVLELVLMLCIHRYMMKDSRISPRIHRLLPTTIVIAIWITIIIIIIIMILRYRHRNKTVLHQFRQHCHHHHLLHPVPRI